MSDTTKGPDLSAAGFEDLVAEMIRRLGDDPTREGMTRTPARFEKAMAFLTKGYAETPVGVVAGGLFEERHESMVLVKDIELYSLCEHHLAPFFGKVHVAYIPSGKIVGLSKVARVVEIYARRLQIQEKLTVQVADTINRVLQPKGVAVVFEAQHQCMTMRGVHKPGAETVTSRMLGAFRHKEATRKEFLALIGR